MLCAQGLALAQGGTTVRLQGRCTTQWCHSFREVAQLHRRS